jgi:general secretion pathway protein F
MAVFEYTATAQATNIPSHGTIAADSPRHARDRLREQGLIVHEFLLHTARPSQFAGYLPRRQSGKVTGFLQELSTLLGAGIPLLEALDTIARQHEGPFKRSLLLLRDHVSAGGTLAEAMAQQPMLFDELCRSIVEVGENAGTIDASLASLVEFRARSAKQRNRVLSALLYPAIVFCVAIGVSVFLMTYVVPRLLEALADTGKPLPFATVMVKHASDMLLHQWWVILAVVIAITLGIIAALRSPKGLAAWHRLQLRLPLVGELIRKQAIARMALVMATLLKSDVVFLRAIRIAQRTVSNSVLRNALVACEHAVVAGRDISPALEKTRAFPPMVIQMLAVGQASGRLESMLERLAADYDTQVDLSSSRLATLLEPFVMILLAVMVGFIAFATILPILEASNVL